MNRFTISLDEQLARQFDMLIAERRYDSRSEAVRDLIRHGLGRASANGRCPEMPGEPVVANFSFVYNAAEFAVLARLQSLSQSHQGLVLSAQQTYLGQGMLLESMVLRGPRSAVVACVDQLSTLRGIGHATLNLVPLKQDKEVASQPQEERHAPSSTLN